MVTSDEDKTGFRFPAPAESFGCEGGRFKVLSLCCLFYLP